MPAKPNKHKREEGTFPDPATGRPRDAWNEQAKRLLQAQMALHDVSYKQLVSILQGQGHVEEEKDVELLAQRLMTRINRGTFSVAFFLQVLRSIGTKTIDISHIPLKLESRKRGS